jgi:hypothetical protein
MELIKKHLRLVLGITLLIILAGAYLLFLLLSISPSEKALVKLEESFNQEISCHEDCYIFRQTQEKIIIAGAKKEEKKLAKMIFNYWQSPEINLDFKKELIRLSVLIYGAANPPDYFRNYFSNSKANLDLVRELVSEFDFSSLAGGLSGDLGEKIKKATTSEEKIEIIKTLGLINNDAEIDNYFILLNSAEPVEVKQQVIKNISNIKVKSTYFTLTQLANITDLIFSQKTDLRLRQELILLIGDYYLVFPEKSVSLWQKVYDDKTLDSISRSFSADNLNHLAKTKLVLPTVSPTDWATYYNQ